jgi:predicted ester cyclase
MSTDNRKALIQQFFEQVINQRNVAALDQFVSPGGVNHTVPPGMPQEADQILGLYLKAFPDLKVTVEDLMADGDMVVARVSYSGTHQGTLRGMAPTGKQFTVMGINIFRIANGKLVEHWGLSDRLAVLQQLGVVPPLAPAS